VSGRSAQGFKRPAAVLLAAVLALAGMSIWWRGLAHTDVQVGGRRYDLQIAATPSARTAGLSGRHSLAADQGMLFAFTKPAIQCMWMKDMYMALDMLWLDHDEQVVHLETNVSPDSYPKKFCSPQPTQYVIELPAGQVAQASIADGLQVTF